MATAILNLSAIEDLALCGIIPTEQPQHLVHKFIESLVLLKHIKSLDVSKNKFSVDSLTFLF